MASLIRINTHGLSCHHAENHLQQPYRLLMSSLVALKTIQPKTTLQFVVSRKKFFRPLRNKHGTMRKGTGYPSRRTFYQRNVFKIGALSIELHRETYLKELGIQPHEL